MKSGTPDSWVTEVVLERIYKNGVLAKHKNSLDYCISIVFAYIATIVLTYLAFYSTMLA